jgi:dTDP-glucose 4,6-dehydratase
VNPIGLRGVYDEAKRFAEALVMAYHRYHGVDTRIARIFNTYGPRMRPHDGRVVSNFIVQALRGEPLTVFGKGDQTRSFCYVDDEIDGLVRLLLAPDTEDVHTPVNIGNPHELTVLEIAQKIIELTGSDSEIVFEPLPEDDPKIRRPDIARAKRLLGWSPKIQLEDGLRRTIEHFKNKLNNIR